MKKLLLITVLFPGILAAQVTEDFSDGDFTQDPAWLGDTGNFKISTSSAIPAEQRPALQLDASGAGISALSVDQHFTGDLEWQFWIKMSLNTSAGNFARIFLLSDQQDMNSALSGYFLQVGGTDDSVAFFRQDSLETTRLFRLNNLFTGNSANSLRFRIERSLEGKWKFYCDSLGGHSPTFQGECEEISLPGGDYFGFSCQYSSSNATKFYFDDIYAGPLIVDTVPPDLLEARLVNPSEVLLTFSEPVDPASAENVNSYEITPGIGRPYEAVRLPDPSQVQLFFDYAMESGIQYLLNIASIADPAGNEAVPAEVPLSFYIIKPYDIIISEIMADPSPPVGLPEFEYLELYNPCGFSLKIEGLRLKIGSFEAVLPAYTLTPGNYMIICDEDALDIMQHVAPAAGVPSFVLPNGGATVELIDTAGQVICSVAYDLSWYGNDANAEGGRSLEMIDTGNPCKIKENWKCSAAYEGGTPGKVNSVAGVLESKIAILNVCCIGSRELLAEFSESLDSLAACDISRYNAHPFLDNPGIAEPLGPDFRSVRLIFNEDFSPGQVYELKVNPGLQNCVGDELHEVLAVDFAMATEIEPFDIIINEVLFNPLGDGVDYVEIFNRSGKTIDLEELMLASVKGSPMELPDTQLVDISASCRVIFPGQYLALSSDPEMVKSQYYAEDPGAFLELSSFPSYNNDSGYVLLMNKDRLVIDGMNYSEEMHFLMLLSYEGVSLEKINPERLEYDAQNWHSAAETAGFGTPGYGNSQYLEMAVTEASVSLQPEVFSPDGDGIDDNLGIACHFDSPGKMVTVLIFNSDGKLARTLVNNEMPGMDVVFSWDGTLDDRTEAQNGIYVIYLEVLGMDGRTAHHKKAAVVARNR